MADNSIIPSPAPQLDNLQNWVIGVIDTLPDAQQAMQDLRAKGVADDHMMLLDGRDGVRAFEAQQKSQGGVRGLVRRLSFGGTDTSAFADEYIEEANQGHVILWVYAATQPEIAQAQQTLQAHGGRRVQYNEKWTAERLSPQEADPS